MKKKINLYFYAYIECIILFRVFSNTLIEMSSIISVEQFTVKGVAIAVAAASATYLAYKVFNFYLYKQKISRLPGPKRGGYVKSYYILKESVSLINLKICILNA